LFSDAERQQLILEAELSGVKTGCLELENQIQLLKQVFFQIKIKFWLFSAMISVSSGRNQHQFFGENTN
jgi:hypothetical protein